MAERWVLNASPIISLARVDRADLLLKLPSECVIPQAVIAEISAGPQDDPANLFLQTQSLKIAESFESSPEIIAWDLGAGETSVISFALTNPGYTAVLDDFAARKCAKSFSIPILGTLAVVIRAKRKNLIPSAADVLHSLKDAGFHLEDRVIAQVLSEALGESWRG